MLGRTLANLAVPWVCWLLGWPVLRWRKKAMSKYSTIFPLYFVMFKLSMMAYDPLIYASLLSLRCPINFGRCKIIHISQLIVALVLVVLVREVKYRHMYRYQQSKINTSTISRRRYNKKDDTKAKPMQVPRVQSIVKRSIENCFNNNMKQRQR